MRPPLRLHAQSQHGAFHARQALACYSAGEVRARVASGRWPCVFGPVYRHADSPPTARLLLTAAGLATGRPVAACLSTAADLHGFGILDDPVTHVVVDPALPLRRRRLLWPHQLVLQPGDVQPVRGGLCATTAVRTAVDLARTLPAADGLALLDAAVASGLTVDDLVTETVRHVGLRGVRQARELVPLARCGPQSPQESRLRWRCHKAGLPPPTVQVPVLDAWGRAVRWLDLGWEEVRVGLEYDGAVGHDGAARRRADRLRHNGLQDAGWAMFYATDLDVSRDRAPLMAQVAAALRQRGLRW